MGDTISGRWSEPFIKSRGAAIALGIFFMAAAIVVFHDAYEVRGSDRPFVLRIIGMPQL